MATYRATLTIEIERERGSKTVVTETVEHDGGGNPRFERSEAEESVHRAMRAALTRIGPLDRALTP